MSRLAVVLVDSICTMMSARVVTFLFLLVVPWESRAYSDFAFKKQNALQPTEGHRKMEKRSTLTFPPDSVLQINAGVTLKGNLERNSAVVVIGLQQNGPLPNESLPLLSPSAVVTARQFSIYDHLRDVIARYGFNGAECLRKMVCQIGETPLLGGLVEDVITFALSPSKHRSVQFRPQGKEWNYLDSLLESERFGKLGGNCSSAYPKCVKTPLDFISTLISV